MSFNLGDLRRLTPISRHFGYDRGTPIDRHYIESHLLAHARDIAGHTLEIGDDTYTRRFGGDRTSRRDVLHAYSEAPQISIVGDLTDADHVPSDRFDCCVVTQTLHLIYDVESALRTLHRILKPGGVLLATFPGISQISMDEWSTTWSWGFTVPWARKAFSECFGREVAVASYGTVLAASAFLHGVAVEELDPELLNSGPECEMVIAVRAVKSEN